MICVPGCRQRINPRLTVDVRPVVDRGLRFVLFDLDGTLVDSVPDLHISINHMLRKLELSEVAELHVRKWVGNGAAKLVERALKHATGSMHQAGELMDGALSLFFHYYQQFLDTHTRVFPGIVELLDNLQTRQITMACITNKPRRFTRPLLDRLNLADYFSCVVCADDLSVKKPDPRPLLHAMQTFGCKNYEGMMIGDSINDIEAARRAGIRAIYVTWGYNQGVSINSQHAIHVDSVAQLHNVITLEADV